MHLINDKQNPYDPFYLKATEPLREIVFFLHFNSQEFQVLNWLTSEGWKAELILQTPSGFELRTPELKIQYLNH